MNDLITNNSIIICNSNYKKQILKNINISDQDIYKLFDL